MALEQLEAVACWHFDWAFRIMQTLRFVDVAGGGVPLIPHELSSCLSLVSDFSAWNGKSSRLTPPDETPPKPGHSLIERVGVDFQLPSSHQKSINISRTWLNVTFRLFWLWIYLLVIAWGCWCDQWVSLRHWGVLQNSMVTSLLGLAGRSLKNPRRPHRLVVGWLVRDAGGFSFLRRDGGTFREDGEICWDGVLWISEGVCCHLFLSVVVVVVAAAGQKLMFLRQWIIFQGTSFWFLIVKSKKMLGTW